MKATLTILLWITVSSTLSAQTPNFQWAARMGANGDEPDQSRAVTVDASGNVYTTGIFRSTVDFDPGLGVFNLVSPDLSTFIQKLDASGNFVWAKVVGNDQDVLSNSIALDATGNVYVTGTYSGTVDFNPGAGVFNLTSGLTSTFLLKVDNSGNFVWAKSFDGYVVKMGAVNIDLLGNIFIGGNYFGTNDFDPGPGTFNLTTSVGAAEGVLVKLDASGNFVWANSIGTAAGVDAVSSIATDASGNVYSTGIFSQTVDFDPGAGVVNLTSNGGTDIFVLKLSPSGNFIWAKNMGGTAGDVAYTIKVDATGNVYTAGGFSGVADFDPGAGTFNLTSVAGSDIFIDKLDASGNLVWAKAMGSSIDDYAFSLAVDLSGNVYTIGVFGNTTDFDPGVGTFNLTSSGAEDIFISKLNSSGNLVWAKSVGGTGRDFGYSIAVDAAGNNVLAAGFFANTVDFDPGAGIYNLTSEGNDDAFVLKLSTPVVTPIELNSFTASIEGKTTVLRWNALSENNSSYFSVERSYNGQSFYAIGKVAAAGTSTSPRYYNFTDNDLISATAYYRLKLVDKDSTFKYSQVISVKPGSSTNLVNVYAVGANAFVADIVSSKNQDITIQFMNLDGKLLKQISSSLSVGANRLSIKSGVALPIGIIYVRLTGETFNKTIAVLNKE